MSAITNSSSYFERLHTKRGEAREEKFTKTKEEPFGLNKRARRLRKGDLTVTRPDGTQGESK